MAKWSNGYKICATAARSWVRILVEPKIYTCIMGCDKCTTHPMKKPAKNTRKTAKRNTTAKNKRNGIKYFFCHVGKKNLYMIKDVISLLKSAGIVLKRYSHLLASAFLRNIL